MNLSECAKQEIKKIPFFVRGFAKKKIEDYAKKNNIDLITKEHILEIKQNFFKQIKQEESNKKTDKNKETNKIDMIDLVYCTKKECPFRISNTEEIAQKIKTYLEEKGLSDIILKRITGLILPHYQLKIGIAGCSNSCVQTQIKDIGLIAKIKPEITENKCNFCRQCVNSCPEKAIILNDKGPVINRKECIDCGLCVKVCPTKTIDKGKEGFEFTLAGKLGRHPRLADKIISIASKEEIFKILDHIVNLIKNNAEENERFANLYLRIGKDKIKKEIEKIINE